MASAAIVVNPVRGFREALAGRGGAGAARCMQCATCSSVACTFAVSVALGTVSRARVRKSVSPDIGASTRSVTSSSMFTP